jgi:quercetin dioxygenase-like cupin family protein
MKLFAAVISLGVLGSLAAYAQAPAAPPAPQPPVTADTKAPLVKGSEATKRQTAFWTENGKPMVARGADLEKAPKSATVIDVKVFNLGGGQNYREIAIHKGGSFAPPKGDALVYVLKGELDVKLGEVAGKVRQGDTFRKIGIQDNKYTALKDTVILETDAPGPK